MNNKLILMIPPNGILKKQDFLFDRLIEYFTNSSTCKVIIIHIENEKIIKNYKNLEVIKVDNKKQIIKKIAKIDYSFIISRGWMHSYKFSALIVKKFPKTIVAIKDWNFSTKSEYKFLFGDNSDFKAMSYIFKNSNKILSHYTKEQSIIWAKKYGVSKEKFVFYPDYCNEKNFVKKDSLYKRKQTIKLVLAAAIAPTSYPEEFFLPKGMLRSVKKLSTQNISVNLMVPPSSYDYMIKNKYLYKDIFYEQEFNKSFNVYKGKILDASILNSFDFGFFLLEYTTKNEYLNKYIISSKFAFYLEAGIPMIINKKNKSLAKIIKKYNLGICFENDDLDNLREKITITRKEYKTMLASIQDYRKCFTYTKNEFKFIK